MQAAETFLSGVLLIQPKIFSDQRGFFYESFQTNLYKTAGMTKTFVQDNISRSCKNTLRGLHYQINSPQAKLVSVISGEVFDVAVDIRLNSPTYGQWFGQILNDKNHLQLYIPEGFAHGFCVLSDYADFLYKCTDYYSPQNERGIFFNDPQIKISWPIDIKNAILSEKDLQHPLLKSLLFR